MMWKWASILRLSIRPFFGKRKVKKFHRREVIVNVLAKLYHGQRWSSKKKMSASVYFISISRFCFFFKYGAVTGASHLSRPAAAVLPAGPSSSTRKEKHSSLQFFHPATVITRPFFLLFSLREPPPTQITDNNNNNFFRSFLDRVDEGLCTQTAQTVGGPRLVGSHPLVYQ